MSRTNSPATQQAYGIKRVCGAWGISRSAWYARREGGAPPSLLGRPPIVSDRQIIEQVKLEIEQSPFRGEGHKKIHFRFRQRGIVVGRNRLCKLMRGQGLLSPSRAHYGGPKKHTGRIVTDRPNELWGTDGLKVLTADEGWVWVFPVIDHWNSEAMGVHVCKKGDRFAAIEAIAVALRRHGRGTGAQAAEGIKLRADHGCQYTSEAFRKQSAYWGFESSYAFVGEPQTNGVVERFNRTLQEQAIYGRVLRNVAEVREAVLTFIEKYNARWQLEKLGYQTPLGARMAYAAKVA